MKEKTIEEIEYEESLKAEIKKRIPNISEEEIQFYLNNFTDGEPYEEDFSGLENKTKKEKE